MGYWGELVGLLGLILPLQSRMVTGGTSTLHPRSRPLAVHLTSLVIACAQP
jgi:hypothetical protein